MIKKLLLIFVILLQISCANNKEDNTNKQTKDTTMNSNILLNKPIFKIRVEKENTELFITLNGEKIYTSYNKRIDMFEYPVNLYLTSGENILKVKMLSDTKEQKELDKNAYAKVSLLVYDANKTKHTISQVIYTNQDILNSTKEGSYNSKDEFKEDKENGDVKISKTTIKKYEETRTTRPYKTYELTQKINLQTPFPRWKFLDSDDILDYNFYNITMDNYYKLKERDDIVALYKFVKHIRDSIEKKDIKSIIDLFDERNKETEIAYYYDKNHTKNELYELLVNDANDEDQDMLAWNPKKLWFYISEGGKTITIKNAIKFKDKNEEIYNFYTIHFRYENGSWIITR